MQHEDMGKALGADGPGCYHLEAKGRTWSFVMPTQADKAEFESWCKQQVLASIRDLRQTLDPSEYRELLAATTAEFAAGLYRWGAYPQAGCLRLMQSEDGVLKLMELCLRHKQPWATREDLAGLAAEESAGVRDALKECLFVPPSRSPATSPGETTATAAPAKSP